MTFVVSLIALLLERFFDGSHLRLLGWFDDYQKVISRFFVIRSPYINLAITLLPILMMIGLIEWMLSGFLYGIVNFLFQLIILLYCLGSRNLWADAFASMNAIAGKPQDSAIHTLKTAFELDEIMASSLSTAFLKQLFILANQRVFAVVFWYVLLGPVGAVGYRFITLLAHTSIQTYADMKFSARLVESWLNVLPIRLMTFLFALGGHFARVLAVWRQKVLSGPAENEALLTECGFAALNGVSQHIAEPRIEKEAISLLDRVFILFLIIIAISVWVI